MFSNMVINTEGNNKMIKKLSILVAALAMMLVMAVPAMAAGGSDMAFWYGYTNHNGFKLTYYDEDCYYWFGPNYVEAHYNGNFVADSGTDQWHELCK
jgi:hypothetical protein